MDLASTAATPHPAGHLWAETALADRAAYILAAARRPDLDESLPGLVGDLVEAAAALALAVLGERGMLRAEPSPIADADHPGWTALQDAVLAVEPNVVRIDLARRERSGVPQRWARSTVRS